MAHTLDSQNHLILYINDSGINNKIGAAAVFPLQRIICKTFLSPSHCFTVYSEELQGIALALNIILSQLTDSQISQTKIFTDNQSTIRSTKNPLSQSGQHILQFIIGFINMLREKGIDPELHWVPAHKEIEGNKLIDVAAKEATG